MGDPRILEVDEERIPKERPPILIPIPPGTAGDLTVVRSKATRFSVFGRAHSYAPRDVSCLYKIVHDEEKKALFIPSSEGRHWKIEEDDPETVYRTWNYAKLARGRVLVLGFKLGLFPRLATRAQSIVAINNDAHVISLVWETVARSCRYRTDLECCDPLAYLKMARAKFDFVYIDLGISRLTEANRVINLARPLVNRDGGIALKGYRTMVQAYQSKCQSLIPMIALLHGPGFQDVLKEMPHEELLFVGWATENWKRVFSQSDYRFVNAWSRKTALKVIE